MHTYNSLNKFNSGQTTAPASPKKIKYISRPIFACMGTNKKVSNLKKTKTTYNNETLQNVKHLQCFYSKELLNMHIPYPPEPHQSILYPSLTASSKRSQL